MSRIFLVVMNSSIIIYKKMKNILCIRHGKAAHNVLNDKIGEKAYFFKGSYDAPLVEEGILQAKELGNN